MRADGSAPGGGAEARRRWRREFGGTARQVHQARAWVDARLDGCPVAADAGLVAAELLTNAMRHTRSQDATLAVAVEVDPGRVRVEVVDQGGPGQPRVTGPHHDRSGGMGLLLVDAVTGGRWGWHGDRKSVV